VTHGRAPLLRFIRRLSHLHPSAFHHNVIQGTDDPVGILLRHLYKGELFEDIDLPDLMKGDLRFRGNRPHNIRGFNIVLSSDRQE
jgi:hypothetical protein